MHISYYLAAWVIFNFLEISWLAIGPLSNPLHFGKPQEPQVLNCQAATGLRVANSKQNSINAKTLCQPKDSAPAPSSIPPPAWVVPLRISNVSNISRKLGCLLSVCLADHFGYLRFLRGRQWQCPRTWGDGGDLSIGRLPLATELCLPFELDTLQSAADRGQKLYNLCATHT